MEKNRFINNKNGAVLKNIQQHEGAERIEPVLSNHETINTRGNLPGNLRCCGYAALQGDWVYRVNMKDGYKIYKTRLDGSEKTKINDDFSKYINVVGDWIYYVNTSGLCELYKIRTDGSGRTKINDDSCQMVHVVGDWIYYINNNDKGALYKIRTDGCGNIKLVKNVKPDYISSINIIDGWIYYQRRDLSLPDEYELYRMRLDGNENTKINEIACGSINVVGDWVYLCYKDCGIYKTRTDGSVTENITKDEAFTAIVDDGWIYYVNISDGKKFYKMRTDGTQKVKISDFTCTNTFNVISDWLYFLQSPDKDKYSLIYEFWRIRTDGTDLQLCD